MTGHTSAASMLALKLGGLSITGIVIWLLMTVYVASLIFVVMDAPYLRHDLRRLATRLRGWLTRARRRA